MSKTSISVQANTLNSNGQLLHVVKVETVDSDKFACVASDFTVRQVLYNFVIQNGFVKCVDAKSQ